MITGCVFLYYRVGAIKENLIYYYHHIFVILFVFLFSLKWPKIIQTVVFSLSFSDFVHCRYTCFWHTHRHTDTHREKDTHTRTDVENERGKKKLLNRIKVTIPPAPAVVVGRVYGHRCQPIEPRCDLRLLIVSFLLTSNDPPTIQLFYSFVFLLYFVCVAGCVCVCVLCW